MRRIVLVSDADAGIGRATSLLLADRGHRVLACGRVADAMVDLPRETAAGGILEVLQTDVSSSAGADQALEASERIFGAVDAVVHVGDRRGFGPLELATDAQIQDLLEANFLGPMRLIRPALACLRARGRGTVVCVSSAAGRVAMPMMAPYSASQYALEGLCDALRVEVAVFGLDVVLVEPGLVRESVVMPRGVPRTKTAVELAAAGTPYERLAVVLSETLREFDRRAATPEDVASVVLRALEAPRPKARYAVSRSVAALLWAKKLLPDRVVDSRLAKRMGIEDIED